ncbi:hypothetical protein E2C01_048689 [Portunus trituberculatus]|uniref:Uncharacterized protein n=1 Tax=Portunus trituberculatus TaxID=210409 RepID=A0A5B7GE33_PORTR|nr:hypothetical protein [Portunus trituberculatus]
MKSITTERKTILLFVSDPLCSLGSLYTALPHHCNQPDFLLSHSLPSLPLTSSPYTHPSTLPSPLNSHFDPLLFSPLPGSPTTLPRSSPLNTLPPSSRPPTRRHPCYTYLNYRKIA